jgi:hypothetical protein
MSELFRKISRGSKKTTVKMWKRKRNRLKRTVISTVNETFKNRKIIKERFSLKNMEDIYKYLLTSL